VFISYVFTLKARLQKVRVEPRINSQSTGKISLKLDSNSSLLLQYGRKSSKV